MRPWVTRKDDVVAREGWLGEGVATPCVGAAALFF